MGLIFFNNQTVNRSLAYPTLSECLMVEVPCLNHLWDGQKEHHNNDSLTTLGSPIGALVGSS